MGGSWSQEIADVLNGWITRGFVGAVKFGAKAAYGKYAETKELEEAARRDREEAFDSGDESQMERVARWGDVEAQYLYGKWLYQQSVAQGDRYIKKDGIHWLKTARDNGHAQAGAFLRFVGEDW